MQDFTAIDVETTGLNPKTEKMIEIGAVKVRDGKIVAKYDSLINPGRKLEERITELTGITDGMLADAPLPEKVLPEFFDVAYTMAGNNNVLADFLVNVLRQDEERGEYLHFKVAEVLQIQNLLENMIYSLVTGKGDQNRINQTTMGLIFLYLLESVQYAEMRLPNQYENMITMTTLDYIEQQYKTATLTELCEKLHLPMHMLSKMIRKNTGFNFKELLQRKRLNKAVELMCETDLPISDIIAAVGYENGSYFHRVFKERYHTTPRAFRVANGKEERVRL